MMYNRMEQSLRSLIVLIISLAAFLPFYALILIALKGPEGGLSAITLIPDFHLVNFVRAWNKSNMARAFLNSSVITFSAVGLLILLSGMAGYSIARSPGKMNRFILMCFLLCMMIPGIINTVPLYTLLIKLRGINTYWAMIIVLAVNALPFSVFLFSGFIKAMPLEMEESAVIDGCSLFEAYWRITFPLLKPVTASVIILQGLGMWNNYAQAVFFLQSGKMRTIPLSISLFFQQYGADWPVMAASALIGLMPAVAAFLFFQKFFIRGITTGAVKG
ncbi:MULTISPECIES: carbohydrate ABC transporter permease [unclassified Oceanispirochaeta]|uniref:carbohydrate ABC transporter permease n=1 Tax=unclassified Oceanispirochaeta TaxID=2635722 RepID=UPI000E09E011|nr:MULTISPECIES: carbohydrate ABC transporter permease [unclassified Oceanispirochaeta]MBF9018004.1 carbohydrate ABC transporter permease [Oceanispirochaeta sp. M2]NPD74516.1 carbohydrate ABC transporter permease [Oceanispirochaeta sp. M1]RDG29629.1 carbohydrate ABC transporter permease [Oceanispirochaeta sp. M1]